MDWGLGIEMQRVDLVMREHRIEEIGEWGNQACPEGMKMDGDLGGCPINFGAGSRPGHRRPPLIGINGERWAHLVHRFPIEHHRPLNGGFEGRQRRSRITGLLLSSLFQDGRHGNGED